MLNLEKIPLEEYKLLVAKSLVDNNKCSEATKDRLMKHYEKDFQEFLDMKLSAEATSLGIFMNLL